MVTALPSPPPTAPSDDEERWTAVLARDARWRDAVVYAVGSTGIYCRPTCASRRPRRSVVTFFEETRQARQAGYRACKRCRPDGSASAPELATVRSACRAIERASESRFSLAELARWAGVQPRQLQRMFQRTLGVSPRQYADACRVSRFKAMLREGTSVTDALYDAGYGSSSRLYERADTTLGMTPASYGKGGARGTIRYGVGDCSMGQVLVAATERGVCALYLHDDASQLISELEAEFPRATIVEDGAALRPWLEIVARHADGTTPALELPLDIRATAFQRRVWEALRSIPRGETRTYTAIAEAIGEAGSARAVGQACARNPVSLAIPCHRAVRSDGGLAGYRWGIDRKRTLIDREARPVANG